MRVFTIYVSYSFNFGPSVVMTTGANLREQLQNIQKEIDDMRMDVNAIKEMQALQTICLRGTKLRNKCLLPFAEVKRFHEASETCFSRGGTLIFPRDEEEDEMLQKYIREALPSNSFYWLGINDLQDEGKYVDVAGAVAEYTPWEKGGEQPANGRKLNCVRGSLENDGGWAVENCREEYPFICEFTIP
uniref:C-type lectin domain family 3, member Bb n=1 Tax=Eptatretus burgeri TaxID=7764 RepID=A0A8C4WYY8_EPTBU